MAFATGGVGAGRSRRRKHRAPMAEINVTPFVDVMLVLLIIFMVTAPLLTAGVPIDLPDSRAKALSEDPEQVTISIDADGGIFIGDEPVTLAQLPERLQAMPLDAQNRLPLVTLRADRGLDYGAVMGVMGELNRAGITAISLVTNASGATPVDAATPAADTLEAPQPVTQEPVAPVIDSSAGEP